LEGGGGGLLTHGHVQNVLKGTLILYVYIFYTHNNNLNFK
jgi:hypothetical protein